MSDVAQIKVTLEFSGGAELLVGKVKKHQLVLDPSEAESWTLGRLLVRIRDQLLSERPELFLKEAGASESQMDVRPGILVLVNDVDWELLGQTSYELQQNDHVTFISTLHGG